jgi:hypothetical protein
MTHIFDTKKAALAYLEENPLSCVQWGNKQAIYFSGKIHIVDADKEYNWSSGSPKNGTKIA